MSNSVSMLDCIKRVPSLLDQIVENREQTFRPLLDTFGDRLKTVDEIVLIGSGTSNTSGITARYLAEASSGLRVSVAVPSEFLYSLTARNQNALYVFLSQTGTSSLTRKALAFANDQGWMTAAISESADTPAAREAGIFLDMGCGQEEYPMRTIGYSTSVLTIALLGMELGRYNGNLSQVRYDEMLGQIAAASGNISPIIDKTMTWLDTNRRNMLQADCLIFTGSGSLYGVALEGAVKVWETPQIISMGYELEEGLHGPNYGYTQRHCVVVLNDGGAESAKATALGKFMKNEKQNGFIVGVQTVDSHDLPFAPLGKAFSCLEFAAVVQVIAYRLAEEQGRDLFAPHDNSVMYSYFKSHDDN